MKTPTTKLATRRLAASIAMVLVLTTSGALVAATNVDWQGGSGGTEESPLDVYDPSEYSGGITALSDAYNLMFDANQTPTFLTNSAPAGTKIANSFCPKYGTWTMLGDYKFSNIDSTAGGTTPKTTTIIKKGDWELTYAAYLGRGGVTTVITNVYGNMVQSGTSWFQIGNGNGGTAIVENLSGDWTINGALELGHGAGSRGELYWRGGNLTQTYTANAFALGWNDNTVAVVEKYAGDWTTTGSMILAKGNNSTASFRHDGGNLNVDGDFYCSYASNSVATVEKNGGDWTLGKTLYLGFGGKNVNSTALTTFYHNGGKMDVASNLDVTYYASCDFYMNGGEVTVGGEVRFGTWILKKGWHHATVNLNGGVLSAKGFYLNNSDNVQLSKVVFDGGTFKANASGYLVSGASTRYDIADNSKLANLRARVGIEVGPKGGTIDTAGHDITNVVNITRTSGTGGMRFVGGGSVVLTGTIGYTGKTGIEVGTTLVVTNSTAVANILKYGIDVTGYAPAGTYTVFRCGEDDTLTDASLSKVTCSYAPESTFAIGADEKSIEITYVQPTGTYWTGAAGDNNLSTPGNWSDNTVPTSGNVTIASPSSIAVTAGAAFAPDTITIPDGSAVITLTDCLTLNALTNAQRLAVASGASLTVTGDLYADGQSTFLFSNEGAVTVGRVAANNTTPKQYELVTHDTQPIRTGGFLSDKRTGRVFFRLDSNPSAGSWIVGENGFAFNNPENRWNSSFYVQSASATLYSSADWTLANSGQANANNGGHCLCDLSTYDDKASLVIDTTDYDDKTTPHTITLNGRIAAQGPVTIKGCGTVVVNTTGSNASLPEDLKHTCITNGTTLAVTDTATLKISAGRKITGNGTVSLAAGTTLALEADGKDFTPNIDPSIELPAEGTATLRIDGERLRSGSQTILTGVAADAADHLTLDMASAALDGRKGSLKVVQQADDSYNLVLDVVSAGLLIIIK